MNIADNLQTDKDMVNMGTTKEEMLENERLNVIILKNEVDLEWWKMDFYIIIYKQLIQLF